MNVIKSKFKERMDILMHQVFMAKMQYMIWDVSIDIMDAVQYFEMITVAEDAIITSLIMKLAKIFDNDSSNSSITIYYIFNAIKSCKEINGGNEILIKHIDTKKEEMYKKNILKDLKIIRDKYQAHLDKNYITGDMTDFYIKERETVEKLKSIILDTLEELNYIYKELFNEKMDNTLIEEELKCEHKKILHKIFKKYIGDN